jgi:hypothetical protein
LTANDYYDSSPRLNATDQVAWVGEPPDGTDMEIYFYNGTTTLRLTNNGLTDWQPQINDSGHVVWNGDFGSEIYVYDGTTTWKLSKTIGYDDFPAINNSGQVVWDGYSGGGDTEIYLATPR